MAVLPRGTVTLVFTDIEGSTRLLHELEERYRDALEHHRTLLRDAFTTHGGVEVDTQGDAFFVAFPTPQGAVHAAIQAQRALVNHPWPNEAEPRVRMGIHTGTPEVTDQGYVGADVHLGARICAAAWGGQIVASSATAAVISGVKEVTLRPLGEHALKDIDGRISLYQVVALGLREDFPALRTLGARPTNLPPRMPALIGRDKDIAAVAELLASPEVTVVTLVGPGGTGKTRLSLAVAAEMLFTFADGAFFVDLSALSDSSLVIPSIAQTLSLREAPGRSLEASLADHLAAKEVLLILDNFEQVIEAAPHISTLITSAPELKVLATSREALRITGERAFSLSPLEVPTEAQQDLHELEGYPAVALFVERARSVKAVFSLTQDNAADVAAICRRLDGLPLALELAAARVNLLSPSALLSRLDQGLKVLTSGRRDAAQRQRTLRGAIAWSYDLLTEDEQKMFRRLGVFAGGFSLESTEHVCDRGDLDTEFLDGLASLVDKSLVRAVDGDEERFSMLETIREFALNELEESGEAEQVRRAHAEFFRVLAEEADPHLIGPEQRRWLDCLESEHDNLRAALRWTIEEEADTALVLASAVGRFWWVRGHLAEGRRWLEAALSIAGASPTVRAQALRRVCFIARSQGDRPTARRAAEEAREVSASIGDRLGVARAIGALSSVAQEEDDLDGAAAYALQSRDLYEELGDREGVAVTTANLGNIALIQGDYGRAASLAEESLRDHRENGHKEGMAASELNIGFAALELGELPRATESFSQALELSRDLDHKELEFVALEALAASAAQGGRSNEAAKLLGEADELRQVGGFARERYEQRLYERTRALIDGRTIPVQE